MRGRASSRRAPLRRVASAAGVSCALLCAVAQAQTAARGFLRLLAPLPGQEVVAKKPLLRIHVDVPYDRESVLVMLDGADISSLVRTEDKALTYTPTQVLAPGSHTLTVALRAQSGLDLSQEFRFSSRHTQSFAQFANRAQFGAEAEGLLDRRESLQPEQEYNATGDINYGLQVSEGRWDTSFETNLWFLNQKLPVTPPPREGLDLASYRLNTVNRGDAYTLSAGLGDIQINGTNHTLGNLARRGGQLGLTYKSVSVGAFAVNAQQLFGFTGGTGIGTDPDTNVYGVTAGIGFFDDKLRFQTIQAKGGEPGSSFGVFTANIASRGQVSGYLLTGRPSPDLEVQAEYDRSEFDANAADAVGPREDDAYALRATGRRGVFNYQVAYEHLGPDYAVVANPVQSDRESVAASGAVQLASHSLSATVLHQFNNVDETPNLARLTNQEWGVDYGYTVNARWLFGTGYRQSQLTSSLDPIGAIPQETQTTGVTGRVQYVNQPWLVSAEVARQAQDDRFFDGGDSTVWTHAVSSAYQTANFSIAPLFSINTTEFPSTGVELEQRNVSLALNGQAWRERIGYGVVLSYYDQQSSDNVTDSTGQTAEVRVAYRLIKPRDGRAGTAVGLHSLRMDSEDRRNGFRTEDWTVWLTLSAGSLFEF